MTNPLPAGAVSVDVVKARFSADTAIGAPAAGAPEAVTDGTGVTARAPTPNVGLSTIVYRMITRATMPMVDMASARPDLSTESHCSSDTAFDPAALALATSRTRS